MVGTGCDSMKIVVCRSRHTESSPAPQRTSVPLTMSIDELWQRISALANMLLLKNGVQGYFDCYRDWRNRTHMSFEIVYNPTKKPTKK